MQDFKKLVVWQKAHKFALNIYQSTTNFPKEEIYGLTSQMRRAGVSIPSNIAEGCGRDTQPELLRFLPIAMGSASELEYQLLITQDLGILESALYEQLYTDLVEIKRMLNAFIQKLKTND